MAQVSADKTAGGCGIFNAVFGKNKFWPRRSASASALSSKATSSTESSKRRRNSFQDEVDMNRVPPPAKAFQQQMPRPQPMGMVRNPRPVNDDERRVSQGKKKQVPKEALGISGELENIIAEHQKSRGGNASLVRASSGNVMLYGHLGNLKQPGANGNAKVETPVQMPNNTNTKTDTKRYGNSVMGNIVKNNNANSNGIKQVQGNVSLCRAISCRMDPEELKILGNEDYKNGRFAEALTLYERAIDIDPSKASYRSNKSAALTALGRLLEAVFECREAIQIEPHYHRAHHRLANLYLRLGEADKALYHFKLAGLEADPDMMAKAKVVQTHVNKCEQAKRIRDWNSLLKATENAITAGADSAPMLFALQAEALLKLHRHQDADTALSNGPHFNMEQTTKYFGPAGNAMLLLIRAQVDMACGRFEDATAASKRAGQLDPSNREVGPVSRRARAIASARGHGNELFKASKFSEASTAYSEGLEHEPYNSVLLCNRAACRTKLGQYEKAVEDCNAALKVRPSYNKARLRRADCNSKLGKWEVAIQDYEVLMRESPGDEEVGRALLEAQIKLKEQRGEDVNDVIVIESKERFRHYISLAGLAVVLFCNKGGEKRTIELMERLCKRCPTIKFLKVDVEEVSIIARNEGVTSFPSFIMYNKGSKVTEFAGVDDELLERSIKEYTT